MVVTKLRGQLHSGGTCPSPATLPAEVWEQFRKFHVEHRHRKYGNGGVNVPHAVKCLHAQAAMYLGGLPDEAITGGLTMQSYLGILVEIKFAKYHPPCSFYGFLIEYLE